MVFFQCQTIQAELVFEMWVLSSHGSAVAGCSQWSRSGLMLAGHSIIFKPQILQLLSDEAALQGPASSSRRTQRRDCL